MQKSNFNKPNNNSIQATTCVNTAKHYAQLFMNVDVKGYSQWFAGKKNNVLDALSWDWHRDDDELTSILRFHFPSQMPEHFSISPLPSKISLWLILLLKWQWLPVSEQLGNNTRWQSLSLGEMDEILCISWMQWPLHGRALPTSVNPHVGSFCHGCQARKIFWGTLKSSGWKNSLRCHFTCGTGLHGKGQTKPNKRWQPKT